TEFNTDISGWSYLFSVDVNGFIETVDHMSVFAATTPVKKKRGRPPKQQVPEEGEGPEDAEAEAAKKARRALNRFNGMTVEEVMSRTLPDVIGHNLDILIIGINPGLLSAYKGHHYPNPGNHFWKCLFLSGLTDQQLNYTHDQDLPQKYGIGFTNMVERTTPGSKDLSNKEIREGGKQLLDKLQRYQPRIAAFNGKGIYEIFCKETFGIKAKNLEFGLQPYKIPQTETVCYLMPSSSPRCAQFPRAQDKVHFYIKLKELRDQMKDQVQSADVVETQYSFDLQLAKGTGHMTTNRTPVGSSLHTLKTLFMSVCNNNHPVRRSWNSQGTIRN
uniref:G/T mismatch-specific thymine DNA glycosylase n=1 Tax=Sphaeramia orbicularis TaxID=375764 RepID=A0A672ZW12_9TELE